MSAHAGAGPEHYTHLGRYRDPNSGRTVVKILPGEYFCTVGDEIVATVLGSCVAVCIRDAQLGIGGMNHFMLPSPSGVSSSGWQAIAGRAARYGSDAMQHLLDAVLRFGATRSALEIKMFGGARVLTQMTDVGARNIAFARRYLVEHALHLVAEDVGGWTPRLVQFCPRSGLARVRHLRSGSNDSVLAAERDYRVQLDGQNPVRQRNGHEANPRFHR